MVSVGSRIQGIAAVGVGGGLAPVAGQIRDLDRRRRLRKGDGSRVFRRAHEIFRRLGVRSSSIFPKSKRLNQPLLINNQNLSGALHFIFQLVNSLVQRLCPCCVRQTASLELGSVPPGRLTEKLFSADRAGRKKSLRGLYPQIARPHPRVLPPVRGLEQNLKSISTRKNYLRGLGLGVRVKGVLIDLVPGRRNGSDERAPQSYVRNALPGALRNIPNIGEVDNPPPRAPTGTPAPWIQKET